MAILIQPRDLCAMVRGWTPGMTPGHDASISFSSSTIEKYSPTVASRPTALRIFPDSYLNLIIPNGERSGYLIVARFGDDYHSITVFANTFTKITNVIWEWMHGCTPIFSTRFVTTYNVIRSPFCPHFNLN